MSKLSQSTQSSSIQRLIPPLLCTCSFSNLLNMRVHSPILVDISQDFGISVAVAGSLGAAYSLPAAILALLFGPLSDRYGWRSLMIFGLGTTVGSVLLLSTQGYSSIGLALGTFGILCALVIHFFVKEQNVAATVVSS